MPMMANRRDALTGFMIAHGVSERSRTCQQALDLEDVKFGARWSAPVCVVRAYWSEDAARRIGGVDRQQSVRNVRVE